MKEDVDRMSEEKLEYDSEGNIILPHMSESDLKSYEVGKILLCRLCIGNPELVHMQSEIIDKHQKEDDVDRVMLYLKLLEVVGVMSIGDPTNMELILVELMGNFGLDAGDILEDCLTFGLEVNKTFELLTESDKKKLMSSNWNM